jgi:hypothetical protein
MIWNMMALAQGPSAPFRLSSMLVEQTIEIRAWVYCRRAWRSIAVTKNWAENDDGKPWERLVAQSTVNLVLDASMLDDVMADGFEDDALPAP